MIHTPGPWELRADPFHFHTLSSIVGGEERGKGARFPSHELHVEIGGFADMKRQEANARLIAAAPDLLAALKLALHVRGTSEDTPEVAAAIESAIAKAEGREG